MIYLPRSQGNLLSRCASPSPPSLAAVQPFPATESASRPSRPPRPRSLYLHTNQPPLSPTTHSPPSPAGDGRGNGQTDPNPKGGRSKKKRECAGSGCGGPQRAPLPGGAAMPTLSSLVALVPVHTIESAAEVVAARRSRLAASESAAALAPPAGRAEIGGPQGRARRRSANGDPTSRQRPRTSTGCERRARSKAAIGMLTAKGGDSNARRKEVRDGSVHFVGTKRARCLCELCGSNTLRSAAPTRLLFVARL